MLPVCCDRTLIAASVKTYGTWCDKKLQELMGKTLEGPSCANGHDVLHATCFTVQFQYHVFLTM